VVQILKHAPQHTAHPRPPYTRNNKHGHRQHLAHALPPGFAPRARSSRPDHRRKRSSRARFLTGDNPIRERTPRPRHGGHRAAGTRAPGRGSQPGTSGPVEPRHTAATTRRRGATARRMTAPSPDPATPPSRGVPPSSSSLPLPPRRLPPWEGPREHRRHPGCSRFTAAASLRKRQARPGAAAGPRRTVLRHPGRLRQRSSTRFPNEPNLARLQIGDYDVRLQPLTVLR